MKESLDDNLMEDSLKNKLMEEPISCSRSSCSGSGGSGDIFIIFVGLEVVFMKEIAKCCPS